MVEGGDGRGRATRATTTVADLYLTEHGAVAHKIGERVVVRRDDRTIADIPLVKVDRVRVFGRGVTLTTALLDYLMDHDIDTVFYSPAQRFRGRLVGPESGHGWLRVRQAQTATDPRQALALAQAVVRAKLINQRFLLRRHGARTPAVQASMAGIKTMIARLDEAPSLDVLRGFEGQAAALYFAGFRRLLRRDLGFTRRAQHPSPDPVNALLSFCYTLLLNDIISAVRLVGLDPYIGFFHALVHNRPALALDLQEEFRPVIVDGLVLALLNDGALGAADFHATEDPMRPIVLGEAGLALVLRRYSERLETQTRYPATGEHTTYRRVLELQARAVARAFDEGCPYHAFAAQ